MPPKKPPYESYFSTAKSVKEQWPNLTKDEASKVSDIGMLAEKEVSTSYTNSQVVKEAREYLTKETNAPEDDKSLKEFGVYIDIKQFNKLIYLYAGSLLMRAFYTGGKKDEIQQRYGYIWVPMKKMMGSDKAAEAIARLFNEKYLQDELVHYLQYLSKATKNPWALKPDLKQGMGALHRLRVWQKA